MGWEERLITLYLRICEEYYKKIWICCQRFTNGGSKSFSDEEALTIYLFGLLRGHRTIKAIHCYAHDHLKSWFPGLPQYAGFVHRINRLSEAFRMLIEVFQSQKILPYDDSVYLVDSFPIVMAKGQHAYTAKVAPELASRSFNATKKMYYYGIKAHVVARKREGGLPDIEILMLEGAARQDGPLFDQMRPMMHNNLAFADKAYKRPDEDKIELLQDLKVLTPTIKERGQNELTPDQKKHSKFVSKIRQPIETLFGWIEKKTGIQNAGGVRSAQGLISHIFGRLAAAMMCRFYPELDF